MRYFRIFATLIVAQLISMPLSKATAATLSHQSIGNWTLAAVSDDSTGQFAYCTAWVTYNSSIVLSFYIYADYSWAASFQDQQWKLTPNAQYPVTLTIDRNTPVNVNATAIDATTVAVPLEGSEATFNEFIHGDMLTLATAGGANLAFRLSDTTRVLPRLLACARAHESQTVAQSTNPFAAPAANNAAPSQTPPPAPQNPQATNPPQAPQANPPQNPQPVVAPAALGASPSTDPQAFADVLNQAGVANYTILSPDQAKQYNADVAWTAGNMVGELLYVDPSQKATLQGINSALLDGDSKACSNGKEVANSIMEASEPKALLIATNCTTNNQTSYNYYTILLASNGGFYVLLTHGEGADPQTADAKIRNIVYNILEN
ncbi:MAG: hypothetical protein AB1508_01005 [Pseudomonadota bacterium]